MTQAQTGDRRIKEIELELMLSRIADSRKQPEQALAYLEQARTAAATGQVHRLLGRRGRRTGRSLSQSR